MINHQIELLTISTFSSVLKKEERKLLIPILKEFEYKAGDTIFSESQPAESIFILEKGSVTLTIPGKQSIYIKRGDMFGELAVINDSVRLGTAIAKSESKVLELDAKSLYNPDLIPTIIALKITKIIAKKHSSIQQNRLDITTINLIKKGESNTVEFKATLKTNLHTHKIDERLELASIKTVAAFLNSNGGTLLVGIEDNGVILGIERDNYKNDDKYLLHFSNLLRDKIGQKTIGNVHYEIICMEDKKVLRVDVLPSASPTFLTHQGTEFFFVRSGPSTQSLNHSDFLNYYKKHF